MKNTVWKGAALVALGLAFLTWHNTNLPHARKNIDKETAFERVLRSNVIRCGYIFWAPYLSLDPNTGEKSGLAYDYMMALAQDLGMKVEWVEEVNWGSFKEGLETKRYDVMCTPVWESGARAREFLLTKPLYTDKMFAYARANDERFNDSLNQANNPDALIAVFDNDITQQIRLTKFPLAQEAALPPLTDAGQYFLQVATHKADIVLTAATAAQLYNANAKIKLKAIAGGKAVRTFSNSLPLRQGEHGLKAMLDSTLHALVRSGKAAEIVKKYTGYALDTN
ncbi:MAG TPA: hypothetical protein DD400_04320 [Rhodospirillaceae bacterium]|nr:hypothetical protein [Rhodospirillaceae bacterium]